MERDYDDEWFCDRCQQDTPHRVHESGHDRDMSNDWRECTVCRWRWSGLTGEYHPPIEVENDERDVG